MDMGDADELAALRARAYGRDADIFDDPAALQRLRELEQRASAADRSRGSGEDGMPAEHLVAAASGGHADSAVPDRPSAHDGLPSTAPTGGADVPEKATPPGPRPFTRRLAALWAASVVAACLVTGVVVGIVTTYDPTVVATLAEAPELGIPDGVENLANAEDLIRFDDYLDVAVVAVSIPDTDTYDPGAECIAILGDPGWNQGGCSQRGFEAVVELTVTAGFPEEFRARHEVGTSLRFVRDGARILIRAVEPE